MIIRKVDSGSLQRVAREACVEDVLNKVDAGRYTRWGRMVIVRIQVYSNCKKATQ